MRRPDRQWKVAYKVVCKCADRDQRYYYSINAINSGMPKDSPFVLKYLPGEMTVPVRGTRIFVFNEYQQALNFSLHYEGVKGVYVMSGLAASMKPISYRLVSSELETLDRKHVIAKWKGFLSGWSRDTVAGLILHTPIGTYACKAFIPHDIVHVVKRTPCLTC